MAYKIVPGLECPICGADIPEEDAQLPCWDCEALPPKEED